MSSRESQRSQPRPTSPRQARVSSEDPDRSPRLLRKRASINASAQPAESSSNNAMNNPPNTQTPPTLRHTHGTIRTVAPEPPYLDTRISLSPISDSTVSDETIGTRTQSRNGTMPHSAKTEPNLSYNKPPPRQNGGHSPSNNLTVTNSNSIQRRVSSEFGPTVGFSAPVLHSSSSGAQVNGNSNGSGSENDGTMGGATQQWDSAVGRASLGKSGRVIERLQSELEKLKRNNNIEKTRGEESKREASMMEQRMEQLRAEHNRELLSAKINDTLLKRRERQYNDLRGQIDGERTKASDALERELVWKAELERVQSDSKRSVEEALDRAAMMEGRNNAMTAHWREQGTVVTRTVSKVSAEVATLVAERAEDDAKLTALQKVCTQQARELVLLAEQKEEMARGIEEYKRVQEEALVGIKTLARDQEARNEERVRDAERVLGELKWALAVKKNVPGAE